MIIKDRRRSSKNEEVRGGERGREKQTRGQKGGEGELGDK